MRRTEVRPLRLPVIELRKRASRCDLEDGAAPAAPPSIPCRTARHRSDDKTPRIDPVGAARIVDGDAPPAILNTNQSTSRRNSRAPEVPVSPPARHRRDAAPSVAGERSTVWVPPSVIRTRSLFADVTAAWCRRRDCRHSPASVRRDGNPPSVPIGERAEDRHDAGWRHFANSRRRHAAAVVVP
jgi:hypothetical protein